MSMSWRNKPVCKKIRIGILTLATLLAVFALGRVSGGRGGNTLPPAGAMDSGTEPAAETTWTCSMHPQIKLPRSGQCPICFMDLIPLVRSETADLGPRTLEMSDRAAALAEILTSPVVRKEVTAEVRLIGQVALDETRVRTISAWIPGRLDTLFVSFTGTRVRKGEPLASVYSPDLYAGQVELLGALQARRGFRAGSDPRLLSSAEQTVTAARKRLGLWGMTPAQIEQVESTGLARRHVRITSPAGGTVVQKAAVEGRYVQTGTTLYRVADLSRVWVSLSGYESDLAWLRTGQAAEFTVAALPGRRFRGKVSFIDPVVDGTTRTAGVRLEVDNGEGLLKPGMYVKAVVIADPDRKGERSLSGYNPGPPLVIPATAPLLTGERAVVYIREPGEKPVFTGREVVLGPRVGDSYIVASGLAEGELVVTRGGFKIDSALQIQARPSMMNPDGPGGSGDGHGHK